MSTITVSSATSHTGIERITRGPRDLSFPDDVPAGQRWVYQGCIPFQVGPHHAALSVNVRLACNPIIDLEAAGDLLLIDSLEPLSIRQRLRMAQTQVIEHPRTGEPIHMSVGWMHGGFVPLGAKRDDGSPHPHAGTGFSLISEHGYPCKLAEQADTHIDVHSDVYTRLRFQQVSFDGQRLRIDHTVEMEDRDFVPGFTILGLGFTPAIPDGDDLIGSVNCGAYAKFQSAFARWRRGGDGRWSIVDFRLIEPEGSEPSLVRDPLDGSLLMSARPGIPGPAPLAPSIHRSTDGGKTWACTFRKPILMQNAPVMLQRALDGTLYLASNRHHTPPVNRFAKRDMLWLWPLNERRDDVLGPLLIRDARADFGPTPTPGSAWRIDHPIANNLRLADGRWRHVVIYRGLEDAEMRTNAGPTDHTGTYIEEIVTRGEPKPLWRF